MKFSITIPAYKQKFLSEAIESVLSQTYGDFELIVVDDCSPDDLKSIVLKYQDHRIRYYRNEKNCGALDVVDNWNICLSYCTGDYVICMGDDDKLLPCCLDEYLKLIEKYPNANILHGWTEIIDEYSKIINLLDNRPERESVYSLMWQRWNGRQQFIGDFLFRVSSLKSNGGYYKLPLAWGSDDITAYINAREVGVVNTQVPVFQYRQTSMTISSMSNGLIKIGSLEQEMKWTNSFLSDDMIRDELDELLHSLLVGNLKSRFIKRKLDTITKDIKFSRGLISRVFYWMKLYPSLNLKFSSFTIAVIKGISQH